MSVCNPVFLGEPTELTAWSIADFHTALVVRRFTLVLEPVDDCASKEVLARE